MELLIGALSFARGFFGPIIFTPGSNQGPLIGTFITGPGGVIIGAIIGSRKTKGQSTSL